MSAIIRGRVDYVNESPSKFPGKPSFYRLKINGTQYGLGRNALPNQGDTVEFTATQKGDFWNIDDGTLQPVKVTRDGAIAPTSSAPVGPAAAGNSYAAQQDTRQDSIIYQSSRKDALQFVELLNTVGAIDFGKMKGADRAAVLEKYVDEFTTHFVTEVKANKASPSQAVTQKAAAATADDFEDELPF